LAEDEPRAHPTLPASGDPIQVGDVVAGKYRVDRLLGEGGMGIVVAATHVQLDERVALKFLRPSVASNPEVVQRFIREARAAVKVRSEHVARVLDVGTLEAGTPYMVMEYLDGQDLSQTIASRGPLPVGETVTYVLQACEAVAEAHSLGIVHRDLKPANLFLARRPNGRPIVKVLDFGISKVASTADNPALTKAAAMMGSPSYMSPEQMVAASSVDVRADVWALGVVLYELLTGKLPFVAETMPELVGMILQNGYTPTAALRPDVPPGLQAAIDGCLQKDRVHRYRNVAELAAGIVPFGPPRSDLSLERISHVLGLTTGVDETISASRSPAALVAAQTFSPMISSDAKPARRRLLWLVPAPLLVIAACVAIFFAWTHSIRPVPVPTATATGKMAPAAPTGSAEPPAPTLAATASEATATAASVAPLPAPTVLEPPVVPRAASPSRRPTATPAPSASAAPACHTVSYFDTEGNRHFRQECP
jgi:serine/threonine-protein kinase